jgi:hypothetical protein
MLLRVATSVAARGAVAVPWACVPRCMPTRAVGAAAIAVESPHRASHMYMSTAAAPALRRPLNLPEDLKPQLVHGSWRKPRLSARRAAKLRKAALLNGTLAEGAAATGETAATPSQPRVWGVGCRRAASLHSCCSVAALGAARVMPVVRAALTLVRVVVFVSLGHAGGGWDPAWDKQRQPRILRVPRGIRHDREQPLRCVAVCSAALPSTTMVATVVAMTTTTTMVFVIVSVLFSIAKIQKLLKDQPKLMEDYKKVRLSRCGLALTVNRRHNTTHHDHNRQQSSQPPHDYHNHDDRIPS